MKTKRESSAVQDYLRALYLEGAEFGPVATSKLARRLGVRDPSVTGMLAQMAASGLVDYAPYRGARLTEEGRLQALAVVRRHRLLETYLVDELGLDWGEVHGEAEALEHAISERLLAVIAAKLGDPVRDPHGDPIPTAELTIAETPTAPLDRLAVGDKGRLVRILGAEPELLAYLDSLGIALGDELEVLGSEPFGGPLLILADGRRRSLGRQAAAALGVEVSS
jgi:DtxR family Mn-dependent transcriptional regulator